MFAVSLLKWWYQAGWRQQAHEVWERLQSGADYFSPGLLLRTMFSLFRQDGAIRVDGPLEVKAQAFMGRIISRLIGAMVRSAVLVVGVLYLALVVIVGALWLALWLLLPLMPLLGAVLTVTEFVPWHL